MARRRSARTQLDDGIAQERLPPVRTAALARVSTWLDHAQSGTARVGLLVGPSGSGKTIIARQAGSLAHNLGFVTLAIEGHLGGAPSAIASQLARELGLAEDAYAGEAALLRAIRFEIQRITSRGRCVCMVFEDVQRYSAADLAVVQDLVISPPANRVAAIVTLEPDRAAGTPPHVGAFLHEVDTTEQIELVTLGRLTREEAVALIETRAPHGAASPRFVRDALELTSGNAMSLSLLAQHIMSLPAHEQAAYLSGSRTLDALPLPPAVTRRADQRLTALTAEQTALLEAFAIWALPATIEVIAEMTQADAESVERQLEALEESRYVVASGQYATPVFVLADPIEGRVLYDRMPVLRRRRMHQRAAALLAARSRPPVGDELVTRANHYLGGSGELERDDAEQVLEAARHLVTHTRYESARAVLTRLVDRIEQEGRFEVPRAAFVLLAETHSRSGAWQEATRALATAAPSLEDDAALGFPAMQRTARDLIGRGNDEEALAIYRRILQSEEVDLGARARVLADAARTESVLGRPDEAIRHYREAFALSESLDDHRLGAQIRMSHATALLMRGHAAAGCALAIDAHRLARRSGDAAMLSRATATLGTAYADAYSLAQGIRWMRRALRHAERSDDYGTVSWIGWRLASAYIEAGEWTAARDVTTTSVHIDAALHRWRSLRRSRAMQSLVHSLRGRNDPLDERLDDTFRVVELFGGPSVYVPDLCARFEREILTGDFDAASATLDTAYRGVQRTPGWERFLIVEVLPRRGWLFAAKGDSDGLEEVLAELESLRSSKTSMLPLLEAQIAYASSQVAAARMEWQPSGELAAAAAAAFGEIGYRWRQALALRNAGHAALRTGEIAAATSQTEEAYRLFEGMGALGQLGSTRDTLLALGRAPKATRRKTTLTARQWQIAELASRSLTDAEIAESLGISRRTVTTHMHNILQVLGMQSRVELRQWTMAHEAERAIALADMM